MRTTIGGAFLCLAGAAGILASQAPDTSPWHGLFWLLAGVFMLGAVSVFILGRP